MRRSHLAKRGIGSGVHYPTPVHLQPACGDRVEVPRRPVRAEKACQRIVSLPMSPTLTESEVDCVSAAVRDFVLDCRQ